MEIFKNKIIQGDCLEVMKDIPDNSVDMILCDLPYGVTACKWDTVIPFDNLWEQYKRIAKDRTAIVLTAAEPFASSLRMSNKKWYKYDWYWIKTRPTNFANAKKMPLKSIENICVFSRKSPYYFPQNLIEINKIVKNSCSVGGECLREDVKESQNKGNLRTPNSKYIQQYTNYPKNILNFKSDKNKYHPTQKPIALFEYLIKTYSNENDTVLDNCIGSGTTAIACINTNRNYIGIDKEQKYIDICNNRIKEVNNGKLK